MSVSRANAAAHLHAQFSNLAAEMNLAASDAGATGYGPDIDQALRALGTAESSISAATVADDDAGAYYALAEFYFLTRAGRQLAARVDVGSFAVDADKRPTIFDRIQDLIEQAEARIEAYGYSAAGGSGGWEFERLLLDYIEPEESA
jgi:hypothetical protein